MKLGPILFGLIAVVYIGFELSMLHKLGYRMEPDHIYAEFARADRAVQRCGEPDADERIRFLSNLAVVEARARQSLLALEPVSGRSALSETEADAALAEVVATEYALVDQAVTDVGCMDTQLFRWIKLHEARARLNLG